MLNPILLQKRVKKILPLLQDVRPNQLSPWASRVKVVPAADDEIMLRQSSKVVIADIIADDAPAIARTPDPAVLVETKIPNIKHGEKLTQKQLNILHELAQLPVDSSLYAQKVASLDGWVIPRLQSLMDGVRKRMGLLAAQMVADSSSYNANGISYSGMTWGAPSDLKVALTLGRRWLAGNESTAKPITDILGIYKTGTTTYGIAYNRLTLSTDQLYFIATTDEFKAFANSFTLNGASVSYAAMAPADLQSILGRIVKMTVEIDDSMYWSEAADGTKSTSRYTPANVAILSDSTLDGDQMVCDMANTVTTESMVASVVPGAIHGLSEPVRGPHGYTEASTNPPGITMWAVARAFPRKHMVEAFGVLNTG